MSKSVTRSPETASRAGEAGTRSGLLAMLAIVAGAPAPSIAGHGPDLEPGDPDLLQWLLPPDPPHPEGNLPSPARIDLGRRLFFEPRLSGDGSVSCSSCHQPGRRWSDGLATALGADGRVLERSTPSLVNVGYSRMLMWDGRFRTLEEQALAPLENPHEMNADMEEVVRLLRTDRRYRAAFAAAYPGEPMDQSALARALAAFQRTLVSRDSRFDAWVAGEAGALSVEEVEGFAVFLDPARGNCAVCHQPPTFSDDGFHDIGLDARADASEEAPEDVGRYAVIPLAIMHGAFKTPGLRDVEHTAPYFHDGSAATLEDVVDHYVDVGPKHQAGLSPTLTDIDLSPDERRALIAFLKALSDRQRPESQAALDY